MYNGQNHRGSTFFFFFFWFHFVGFHYWQKQKVKPEATTLLKCESRQYLLAKLLLPLSIMKTFPFLNNNNNENNFISRVTVLTIERIIQTSKALNSGLGCSKGLTL